MLIPSTFFLVYFLPLLVGVYWLLYRFPRGQNMWLYAAALFYIWRLHWFLLCLALLWSAWSLLLGLRLETVRKKGKQGKVLLAAMCLLAVACMSVFYWLAVLPLPLRQGSVWLQAQSACPPVLMCLLLLQTLAVFGGVWRGELSIRRAPCSACLSLLFFPLLAGGPPISPQTLYKQFHRRAPNIHRFSNGCARFCIGLGKKALISSPLSAISDRIFDLSSIGRSLYCVPASLAWLGFLAFGLQIYYELSAFADMALGLGMMLGYRWSESFHYPYTASSTLHDFWRRWNIPHSSWFQNHYSPILESRRKNNLLMMQIVFPCLFMGLSFGRGLSSLLWSAWHIFFLSIEFILHRQDDQQKRPWKILYVLFVSALGWIWLRAPDAYQAIEYIKNMFALNQNGFFSELGAVLFWENLWPLAAAILFCFPIAPYLGKKMLSLQPNMRRGQRVLYQVGYALLLMVVYLLCFTSITQGNVSGFHLFG